MKALIALCLKVAETQEEHYLEFPNNSEANLARNDFYKWRKERVPKGSPLWEIRIPNAKSNGMLLVRPKESPTTHNIEDQYLQQAELMMKETAVKPTQQPNADLSDLGLDEALAHLRGK